MKAVRSVHVRLFAVAALALICGLAMPARAEDLIPVRYQLMSPSELETGCQPPCGCPSLGTPLKGTLLVSPLGFDGLFQNYEIGGVDWPYYDWVTRSERRVTGRGLYRLGGEIPVQHQLLLELEFGGGPTQYFDSGVQLGGAAFPRIDLAAAIHGFFCFDSVVMVVAEPARAGVDAQPLGPSLSVTPNPFHDRVLLAFVQGAEGAADLRIFDLAGREVRVIERGDRLSSGPHMRGWDGRDARGVEAPAGTYFARLVTAAGVTRRGFIKLE